MLICVDDVDMIYIYIYDIYPQQVISKSEIMGLAELCTVNGTKSQN